MKNIIYLLCICFVINACKKKNDNSTAAYVSTNIDIKLVDSSGNDLLDTTSFLSYKYENITHYYIDENNITHQVYLPNLEYPKQIMILTNNDSTNNKYILRLFPYISDAKKENGLYICNDIIKWSSNVNDTVQSEITITTNTIKVTRVWYKKALVYLDNNNNNQPRILTITK